MISKKQTILQQNRQEIYYNLINSFLAGGLVFLGSLTAGFSWDGVCMGFIAGGVVAVTKFKDYWTTQEGEYKHKPKNKALSLFTFI